MSNHNSRRLWKTAAATIAGAVLAMSYSVAPATAAPLVDGSQTGSITVHKFERPSTPSGLPNNGTAVDTTANPTHTFTAAATRFQQVDDPTPVSPPTDEAAPAA